MMLINNIRANIINTMNGIYSLKNPGVINGFLLVGSFGGSLNVSFATSTWLPSLPLTICSVCLSLIGDGYNEEADMLILDSKYF